MTARSKTDIKAFFERGDKPTQAQFEDLIDSYQDASSVLTAISTVAATAKGLIRVSAGEVVAVSAGSVGLQVLTADATAAAQQSLGGSTLGRSLFEIATTAATQQIIGGGTVGRQIFEAATTAAVTNITGGLTLETGTWTPVFTFATPGNLSVTYGAQLGFYFKIGSLVIAQFNVALSVFTHSTASGVARITGLPFTSVNTSNRLNIGFVDWQGITKANFTQVSPIVFNNSAQIDQFQAAGSGQSTTGVAAADMPSGGTPTLRGFVIYEAA